MLFLYFFNLVGSGLGNGGRLGKLDFQVSDFSLKVSVIKQSYEKYKDGKLDIEKYRLKREIAQNHIQTNNDELVEIEDKANMLRTEEQKALEWIQHLYKAEGIQKLSKELIDMLVEKIVVMDREHFDIEFRFAPIELKGACKDE